MSNSIFVVSTPLNNRTLSGVEAEGSLMQQHFILTTYVNKYNKIIERLFNNCGFFGLTINDQFPRFYFTCSTDK